MEAFKLAGSTRLSHCTSDWAPPDPAVLRERFRKPRLYFTFTPVYYITPHLLPTLINVQYCVDTAESPVSAAGPKLWFGHLCDGAYVFTAYFMAIHISMCHTSLHSMDCVLKPMDRVLSQLGPIQCKGVGKKVWNLNLCVCATTLIILPMFIL